MDVTSVQRPDSVRQLRPAATPAATFTGTAQDKSSTTTPPTAQRTRIEHYEDVTHLAPKGDGRELMKQLYTPEERQEMANRLIEMTRADARHRQDRINFLEQHIDYLNKRNAGKSAMLSIQEKNRNEQVVSDYREQLYRFNSYEVENDAGRKAILRTAAMMLDTSYENVEQMV
ncbi:hypothetical protein [Pannonibacter sp.]|uniref:hypothetical protein n=1 Tax=Pannonibacter sp. TaxID=1906786 RepID=UPI003F6F9FBA